MTEERCDRAELRRFALEHHPDRGGDVEEFLAGMAARRGPPGPALGDVVVFRRPKGVKRPLVWVRQRIERSRRPPRVQ